MKEINWVVSVFGKNNQHWSNMSNIGSVSCVTVIQTFTFLVQQPPLASLVLRFSLFLRRNSNLLNFFSIFQVENQSPYRKSNTAQIVLRRNVSIFTGNGCWWARRSLIDTLNFKINFFDPETVIMIQEQRGLTVIPHDTGHTKTLDLQIIYIIRDKNSNWKLYGSKVERYYYFRKHDRGRFAGFFEYIARL